MIHPFVVVGDPNVALPGTHPKASVWFMIMMMMTMTMTIPEMVLEDMYVGTSHIWVYLVGKTMFSSLYVYVRIYVPVNKSIREKKKKQNQTTKEWYIITSWRNRTYINIYIMYICNHVCIYIYMYIFGQLKVNSFGQSQVSRRLKADKTDKGRTEEWFTWSMVSA